MQPRDHQKPIPTTAERLERMERDWKEANERQRKTINRLALSREDALRLIAEAPDHQIHPKLRASLLEALNR